MANTDVVLEGVKEYTLELLGTKARDESVDAAGRAEGYASRAETAAEQAGADRVQTGADRRQTGEDRAQTGEDREATEGWAAQSKDAATLAITAAATVTQYVGDGFPEGKVTAPVGSVYTDTAATAGAIRWIKTGGTGTTGWRISDGDTGWRNISSLLINGWSGAVFIRRFNTVVELRAEGLTRSATSNTIMSLPAGFLPEQLANQGTRFTLHQADPTASQTRFRAHGGILSTVDSTTVPGPYYGGSMWTSSSAWPTVLPGTPA